MGKEFGERLSKLIRERKLTQKELAREAGVTEAAVSHYIKGDRMPRATVMARIAGTLHTTSEYLMNGTASNTMEEVNQAKRLLARHVNEMSREEKMQIIDILFAEE